jgi:DNA polymerase III alpha subunit
MTSEAHAGGMFLPLSLIQGLVLEIQLVSNAYEVLNVSAVSIATPPVMPTLNFSVDQNKDNFPKLKKYNRLDSSINNFDKQNQNNWFMPKNYCPNLIEQLYDKCTTEEEKHRVNLELELFIQHGMLDLLFYLKYLVDAMRKHNIVWGVGRGSSVASFILYLIGVHKINSIKYNLDIHEFLK